MNTKTKLLISGFIALSLVLSIAAFNKKSVVVQQPDGTVVGAISPYSPTPEINLGGLRLVPQYTESLTQASSTICALQAPTATSTLISAGLELSTGTTSAVAIDFAKNSTRYSTTTKIGTTYSLDAGAKLVLFASTTGSVAGDGLLFEPNYWFVVKWATVDTITQTKNAPVGTCFALWAVI